MKKTFKLNNGHTIPTLGLGTWKSEPKKVGKAVKYAILEGGYTHIDGAAIYRNEPEVGRAYAEIFKSTKRESVFITSKLWNTNHAAEHVESAYKKTLKDLQLDYLDLYLMHWGVAFRHGLLPEPIGLNGRVKTEKVSIRETWEAMEQLVEKGLVKSIGVANFTTMMLVDLLTYAKIKPVTNQIEVHPYNSQRELVDFCRQEDILVTAYSPLGRQGVATVTGPRLFTDPVVVALAAKYGRSPSQILLNWAIARGTVPIPKSVTPERITENIQVFDFDIEKKDREKIDSLNQNLRFVNPSDWWGVPYFK